MDPIERRTTAAASETEESFLRHQVQELRAELAAARRLLSQQAQELAQYKNNKNKDTVDAAPASPTSVVVLEEDSKSSSKEDHQGLQDDKTGPVVDPRDTNTSTADRRNDPPAITASLAIHSASTTSSSCCAPHEPTDPRSIAAVSKTALIDNGTTDQNMSSFQSSPSGHHQQFRTMIKTGSGASTRIVGGTATRRAATTTTPNPKRDLVRKATPHLPAMLSSSSSLGQRRTNTVSCNNNRDGNNRNVSREPPTRNCGKNASATSMEAPLTAPSRPPRTPPRRDAPAAAAAAVVVATTTTAKTQTPPPLTTTAAFMSLQIVPPQRKASPIASQASPVPKPIKSILKDSTRSSALETSNSIHVQDHTLYDAKGQLGLYTGSIHRPTGLPEGSGSMHYAGASTTSVHEYEGDWVQGLYHGHGRLVTAQGDVYQGPFDQGLRHGGGGGGDGTTNTATRSTSQATMVFADGRNFQGSFRADRMYEGVLQWKKNGSSYQGSFDEKSKRHGFGVYTFPNGDIYKGDWKQDKMHGQGTMTWKNSASYRGEWLAGMQHGIGTETNHKGEIVHQGHFQFGKPDIPLIIDLGDLEED